MKALVTGASGFIGSTLVEELGILGFDVRALLRRTSSTANLEGLKYEKVEGDLFSPDALRQAVKGVDYVFHLAGLAVAKNKAEFFECNSQGTKNLADAVAEHCPGLTRFVYVSSLAAGGPSKSIKPRDEAEKDEPVSAYGESKLKAEQELFKHKGVYPISVVRPPLVYGPRDKATFIFVKTISRNLMPLLKGSTDDGQKYYSSIHVKDLVRGIVQAGVVSREKVSSAEIFYLAGDGIDSYERLMTIIADHLNREPLKIRIPKTVFKVAAVALTALGRVANRTFPLNLDKLNEVLPDYWICSNQKAKSLLGFKPEFDLSTGLPNAIEWYKQNHWI